MLSFDDPRWSEMKGGYKVPFDPRPLLRKLAHDPDVGPVWSELWNELHHQGDVGEASFAAVLYIVKFYCDGGVSDWNAYAIIAVIELARNQSGNPDVPDLLRDDYFNAIRVLAEKGISELPEVNDPDTCCAVLGMIAIHKGLRNHALLLTTYSDGELQGTELTWPD